MPATLSSPWTRLQQNGVRTASPTDLLAVALSRTPEDASLLEKSANELLTRCGDIRSLGNLSLAELQDFAGLDATEAMRLLAMLEVGRRVGLAKKGEPKKVVDAKFVAAYFGYLRDEKKEYFVALLLNAKNQVIRSTTIHIGTLTQSVVGGREVFREAVREGASAVIVAHNHPSGDPEPSPEDIDVTERLMEVGAVLDIPLLDHVILGEHRWVSLRARGVIR
jgi:DNA repair protein RadC